MTAKQIQNLVKIFYKQEELIIRASGVRPERFGSYTRRVEKSFVDKIVVDRNMTMAKMADAYYANIQRGDSRYSHYCKARYRTLNLHNLWNGNKHTVEFRFFEATLHAGEMRTNILLALTLVAYAKEAKAASGKGRRDFREASAKYDLRVFLLRLGWIGDEFKNPRKHMMKRLSGSAAWKNGRPQVATTAVAVTTTAA